MLCSQASILRQLVGAYFSSERMKDESANKELRLAIARYGTLYGRPIRSSRGLLQV